MFTPTPGTADDTRPLYHSAIRHRGPCGPRRPCWRPACRQANGDYLTIEVLPTGWIAYCHGTTGPRNDPLLGRMVA